MYLESPYSYVDSMTAENIRKPKSKSLSTLPLDYPFKGSDFSNGVSVISAALLISMTNENWKPSMYSVKGDTFVT